MRLERKNEGHILIYGVVKSFTDSQQLKEFIDINTHNKEVVLEFIDAYSLASSIIGYLNKKIYADGLKVELRVHQKELFELLDMLSLISSFNVKKVS